MNISISLWSVISRPRMSADLFWQQRKGCFERAARLHPIRKKSRVRRGNHSKLAAKDRDQPIRINLHLPWENNYDERIKGIPRREALIAESFSATEQALVVIGC